MIKLPKKNQKEFKIIKNSKMMKQQKSKMKIQNPKKKLQKSRKSQMDQRKTRKKIIEEIRKKEK